VRVTRRTRLDSTSIVQRRPSRLKAMREPSGDHVTPFQTDCVNRRSPEPSAFTT
jgi:hypothetical protein